MRLSRFVSALARAAPLLARGSAAQTHSSLEHDPSSDTLSYRLPLNEDDEAFKFNIQALEQTQDRACGDSQLQLQSQDLRRDWHPTAHGDLIGTSQPSVVVRSERTGHNRNLDLSIISSCLSSLPVSAPVEDEHYDETASTDVIEHTTVIVNSVDSAPLDVPIGFNVYLNQQTGRILGVTPASSDDFSHAASNQQHAEPEEELAGEQAHLSQLKAQLEALTADVMASEARVQELDHSTSSCSRLSCAVVAFFRRIGGNIRILIQKLPSLTESDKCARGQAVLGNCHGSGYGRAHSNFNSSSEQGTPKKHKTLRLDTLGDHVILSVVVIASVFGFSCVLFTICRFCFSARAQADWRATCEEVRTRRQFRQLQRHHKYKMWWDRLLGRSTMSQRTGDYDEKRRMILSQEHVLENIMQDEIYRIRIESGMTPEEAWEARLAADGTTESLPAYRAQMSDGPPSYRTTPSDGGRSRTGSSSGGAPSISDATPDSSIANLSPRHSSETLRTDGSFV